MSGPVDFTLARDPNAVAQARRLVAELCAAEPDREDLDRAKLLVSELVTNALVHGQGMITLRVDLGEDRLLVEVIDEGSGLEQVTRQTDPKPSGGWGLSIVDAEASRWGVHEGLAHVWFEVERPGPRIANNKHPAHSGL